MNATAPHDPTSSALRHDALEQVMRACDDESVLELFAQTPQGSDAAAGALGRAMAVCPQLVAAPGTPVAAWVGGGPWDVHWREWQPVTSTSLYAQYQFLCDLYGPPLMSAHEGLGVLQSLARQECALTLEAA